MGLRQRLHDLAKSPSELEAEDIRAESANRDRDGDCSGHRAQGSITGVVRSVTLPPTTSVPLLEAEVFDGEHSVRLLWIGQRRIPGIEPGVFLQASGRVCLESGQATIRNPRYEILPPR